MDEEKQYISRVKLTNGTTVEIKDQEARTVLDKLLENIVILDCGSATE